MVNIGAAGTFVIRKRTSRAKLLADMRRRLPFEAEAMICDRIEEALVAPVVWPGGRWYPRASMGTARRRPGDDTAALIRRADEAMYVVKRAHHARDAEIAAAGRVELTRRAIGR